MKEIKIAMMTCFPVFLFSCFPVFLFSCLLLMGCPNDDINNKKKADALGKIIILQAYGSSSDAAGASHSFVELYNTTDKAIKMNGISLYYADGTTVGKDEVNEATEDGAWQMISLDGKTIPAKGSFLILGPKESPTARYQIPDNYGDINSDTFKLSNRSFKVALLQRTKELTVQNPFDTDGNGEKIAGYIDMVGAANAYGRDLIYGFEKAPARNSASEAVRRQDLEDYDDNSTDFIAARYASDGMSAEMLEARKPKNSTEGTRDPFASPVIGEGSSKLMILQVGAATDGAVSHTFIELYNNTSQAITLNGAYSLQYAAGTKVNANATEDGAWTKIDLTGTIPPKHSFLILGKKGTGTNPALSITDDSGDINQSSIELSNRAGKVVLMQNQTLLNNVQNPFNSNDGQPVTGYVDMIGYYNDNTDQILGFETQPINDITKQAGARRVSLTDSDNNLTDFEKVAYNSNTLTAEVLALKRPKNLAHGEWNPILGE